MKKENIIKSIIPGKIENYSPEFLKKLSNISYQNIPVSILVLSFTICNQACYPISILLTKGLSQFKLIRGDVNIYPKEKYPNHCWVEFENFVLDPTDGLKWNKDIYYQKYNPEIKEIYNEDTIKNDRYYKEVETYITKTSKPTKEIKYVLNEIIEQEKKIRTLNYHLLVEEINSYKEKYQINSLTKKENEAYQNLLNTYNEEKRSKKKWLKEYW